jgi:hypothetical protein
LSLFVGVLSEFIEIDHRKPLEASPGDFPTILGSYMRRAVRLIATLRHIQHFALSPIFSDQPPLGVLPSRAVARFQKKKAGGQPGL